MIEFVYTKLFGANYRATSVAKRKIQLEAYVARNKALATQNLNAGEWVSSASKHQMLFVDDF
jgi:hypothetical protein